MFSSSELLFLEEYSKGLIDEKDFIFKKEFLNQLTPSLLSNDENCADRLKAVFHQCHREFPDVYAVCDSFHAPENVRVFLAHQLPEFFFRRWITLF